MIGRVVEGMEVLQQIGGCNFEPGQAVLEWRLHPMLMAAALVRLQKLACLYAAAVAWQPVNGAALHLMHVYSLNSLLTWRALPRTPACTQQAPCCCLCHVAEELAASSDGTPRTDVIIADCGVL